MRKKLTVILLSMFAMTLQAQETDGDNRLANIDWKEDTMEITTIKDIVRTQQMVNSRSATAGHFAKVWKNHGFFALAYHTKATMTPVDPINTGVSYNGGVVPAFKAKYGASMLVGKNIKLHKPIANMLQFNIDYTGIDLNFNYYKAENGGANIYDSDAQWTYTDDDGATDLYYLHWNLDKYEVSYGMSVGPSLTLAPFTHIQGARGLHYLRFNGYWHIGYCASFMLMIGDIESDVQYANLPMGSSGYKTAKTNLENRNENQFVIGHGLYQTMGFNVTWKRIGLGYEHRWGKKIKYKNMVARNEYGKESYKFDTTTNRIYLTYRFGN